MKTTLIVLAALIGLASAVSAMGEFAKKPDVMAAMAHVGVKANQVPPLGLLELLGALGLLCTSSALPASTSVSRTSCRSWRRH